MISRTWSPKRKAPLRSPCRTINAIAQTNVYAQAAINLSAVGQSAGLAARYSGPGDSNMYWGAINQSGANTFTALIYKNIGGTWTQLASQSVNSGTGILRFEVVGDSLKLFLSNNIVAFANDTSITSPGSVGIRAGGVGTTLDNFEAGLLASSVVSGTNFSDNFFAHGDNRKLQSPQWQEHVGNFRQPGLPPSGPATVINNAPLSDAMLNGLSLADVYVQADINLAAVGQSAGLAAHYIGPGDSNMYWGAISQTGANSFAAVISKNIGGVWTQLASQSVNSGTGSLSFTVVGESLKLFLGINLVAYANDASITAAGSSGMRAAGVGTTFSNFSTGLLTTPPFSTPFGDNFNAPGNRLSSTGRSTRATSRRMAPRRWR